jgi:hypothetical protein
VLGCAACAGLAPRAARVATSSSGDDQFRASQRLVLEGLDADERGDAERARSRYERALPDRREQSLGVSRARATLRRAGGSGRALAHLDRAEALLDAQDGTPPGPKAHCDGLRGAALALEGNRSERTAARLGRAQRTDVWGDGDSPLGAAQPAARIMHKGAHMTPKQSFALGAFAISLPLDLDHSGSSSGTSPTPIASR